MKIGNNMKQTCILILGMHRSGTSALTGTLNLLDVDLGSELMKGAINNNDKGFYENIQVYNINEKLLKQMNSSWDDIFFNKSKLNVLDDITELESMLRKEFQHSQLFTIKDPRLTYLFPLYKKALTNMGVDIKVIIPHRNPLEVANSLKKRNQFNQKKGLLLWAYHFLLAEKHSRALPRVFCSFDELIKSPQKLIKLIDKKLMLDLNSKYNAKKFEIADFLMPDLKHHNISIDNMQEKIPKLIWNIMRLMPKLNEVESEADFDELRQQLFDNQNLFYNDSIMKIVQEFEKMSEQMKAKEKEFEQMSEKMSEQMKAKEKEFEQMSEKMSEKMKAKEKELEQMSEKMSEQMKAKEKELEQMKNELNAIQTSTSWKITRPLRKIKSSLSFVRPSVRKKK